MKRLLSWLLVIICIATIAYFSRQPFSQQDISPYINKYPAVVKMVKTMPLIQFHYNTSLIDSHANTIGFIQFIIRKVAHLTIYGLFGLSLLFALQGKRKINYKTWLLAGIIVLVVASGDELNQLQNSDRTGCTADVIMDFTGYLIFSTLYLLIAKLKNEGCQ